MKRFTILTTALIRNDVHKKGILNFLNLILESKKIMESVKINLIINLDIVKRDKEKEIALVKNVFMNLSNKNVAVYLLGSRNPCFHNAFKRVFKKANEIINGKEDNIFMWLEDDWYITKDNFEKIVEPQFINYINDKNIDCLTMYNEYPSGPPYCFKKKWFNMVVNVLLNEKILYKIIKESSKDPEQIKRNLYCKYRTNIKIKQIGSRLQLNEYIKKNLPLIFVDVGRQWQIANNLKKWSKGKKTGNCAHKDK